MQTKSCLQGIFRKRGYLYGYVTIFLAGPGIWFKECYSVQNSFAVLTSISCSQSLSQSAPESLARQYSAPQGLVCSWHCWRKVCSCRWKPKWKHRYSCCGCACLQPTLLFACHCRCKADSGSNSHQALSPSGAGVWCDVLSCALLVWWCSQPSKEGGWISHLCCRMSEEARYRWR